MLLADRKFTVPLSVAADFDRNRRHKHVLRFGSCKLRLDDRFEYQVVAFRVLTARVLLF